MSVCITKSDLELSNLLYKFEEHSGNYYRTKFIGRNIKDIILDETSLKELICNSAITSDLMNIWREKEAMYQHIENNDDLEADDKVCYSQEYFALKSKIVEPLFRAIILTDDYDLFLVRAEIKGTYKDYETSKKLDLVFITEYIDSIFCTPYEDVNFLSLEGYLSTRTDFVL